MTDTTERSNLPTLQADAAANILKASEGNAQLLKFKKSRFYINDTEVPLGGRYLVYCSDWMKGWVKFIDGELIEKKIGRVADGYEPPERDELDELEHAGTEDDPWTLQHYLPIENLETGDRYVFVSGSAGGAIGVRLICNKYARNIGKGLPIAELAVGEFTTKQYGKVPRPDFPIIEWEHNGSVKVLPPSPVELLDDSIPF